MVLGASEYISSALELIHLSQKSGYAQNGSFNVIEMSARWKNRKSQTSFFHSNTEFTTVLETTFLEEKFRSQLRSCSIPDEHKNKISYIEMGKKANLF